MDFHFFKENIIGGRKYSLIVVGPGQRKGPPMSFHNTYRFLKHNTYRFYIKSQKQIYCAYTGVDPGMSTMGDAHVDTPTTLSELTSPKQPRWSAISVSPYAASISGRP